MSFITDVLIDIGTKIIGGGDKDTSGRVINDVTANVNKTLDLLKEWIDGEFAAQAGDIDADLFDLEQGVNLSFLEQRDFIQAVADQSENDILGRVNTNLRFLYDTLATGESAILQQILRGVLGVEEDTSRIVSRATSPILAGQNALAADLDDIDLKVNLGFDTVLAGVGGILEVLTRGIVANIENNIVLDSSIFDLVLGKIDEIVGEVIRESSDTTRAVIDLIEGVFGEELRLNNFIEADQADSLLRIAEAQETAVIQDQAAQEQLGNGGAEGIGGAVVSSIFDWLDKHAMLTEEELARAAMEALFGGRDPNRVMEECNIRFSTTKFQGDFATRLVDWITAFLSMAMLPLNMAQVQANREIQEFRKCFPDVLPGPGDVAAMFQRALYTGPEAIDKLRRQGFSGEDAAALISSAFRIPDIQFLFSMWYRGIIDDAALDYSLEAQGFNPVWLQPLKEIALYIPPVQDLITMAVREVFDEDQARANGQFEDFPEDFAHYAAQQGVSPDWARRYWAAHWRLPSEHMGFEMYHRQLISEDQLRGLMTALDIMPGWRDEMIAISYNPLTRVDVRRMHALGVLDREEVVKAYRDVGYSPENAELLTRFTEEYNDGEPLVTLDVASDVTRANIIGFYKDGIIEREAALALLIQAGINVAAAELFLLAADFDLERGERKDTVALILGQFKYGMVLYDQAADQLRALPIEERERALALIELEKLRQANVSLPSKTDLAKFYSNKLITENEYLASLELLGYARPWAEKYLALTQKGNDIDA